MFILRSETWNIIPHDNLITDIFLTQILEIGISKKVKFRPNHKKWDMYVNSVQLLLQVLDAIEIPPHR